MKKTLSYAVLFAIATVIPAVAQENQQEEVQVEQQGIVIQARQDGEGGPVQVFSMQMSDGSGPMMGNFVFDSPLPMIGGPMADPSQLMFNPQVRSELELADDQVQKLRDISSKFTKRLKEEMKFDPAGGQSKLDIDRIKNIQKVLSEINKEREAAIGAVLLPHQAKRLKQISTQMKMKNGRTANALVSGDIAEELGIDDEQKKRIKKRAAEIKKQMEEEIAKIKAEAEKELLQELDRDQRNKLKDMTGDKFELKRQRLRRFKSREKSDR